MAHQGGHISTSYGDRPPSEPTEPVDTAELREPPQRVGKEPDGGTCYHSDTERPTTTSVPSPQGRTQAAT